jgi:hypothetical protein
LTITALAPIATGNFPARWHCQQPTTCTYRYRRFALLDSVKTTSRHLSIQPKRPPDGTGNNGTARYRAVPCLLRAKTFRTISTTINLPYTCSSIFFLE